MDMFVDDTDLVAVALHTQPVQTPITMVQNNLHLWNTLLQASGGELNPSKCVWFCFFWKHNPNGQVKIRSPPPQTPDILLSVHDHPPVPIKRLAPEEAHRYLGVQLTTDRNYAAELQIFAQCNNRFLKLLQQCPFSFPDVTVIYKQCYLLTVSYPLAATAIPPSKLLKTQSPTTSIFLQKMGFPSTFPRAVAYAASDHGGLRFRNLGHEQGVQKCLQILKHLRTNTEIGSVYHITLQHYQLASGLSQPVLQDTWMLPWSSTPWIDNL